MNSNQVFVRILVLLFIASLVNLYIVDLASSSTQRKISPLVPQANNIATSTVYDDEFNSPTLNPNWYWHNEDSSHWSLTTAPGNLRIITQDGDLFNPCGSTAKNILLQQGPFDNFEIETKLSANPTGNFQQAGLLIMKDLTTYIKIVMAWNSQQFDGLGVSMAFVKDGDISQRTRLSVDPNQPIHLKISKIGTVFTGYYSLDGQQYIEIDKFTTSEIVNPQIGVMAINSCFGNVPEIPADFDYFRVTLNDKFSERV